VAAGILDDGLAFPGTDDLRFVAPVYIGDTLHVEAELLEKSLPKAGERGTLRYKWRTLNQEGKEVARGINACLIKVGFLEAQKR